jgi:hypothetical protein
VSLDKEFQKITQDAKIGRRLADKLFKVWLKNGKEAWLLFHIEVQGRREKMFGERMFTYSYRIFDMYHKPVISIAVLCDDDPGWKPDHFGYNMWGCEMGLRFLVVKVLDYRGQEERLEADRNPFAAIVLAQLKAMETRQSPEDRRVWKLRLFKGLFDRGLKREDIQQLLRLIDWMMTLPEELEEGFRQDLHAFEEERHVPYITSFERYGLKKGREEGLQEGLQTGIREGWLESISMDLDDKFGAAGKRLVKEMKAIKDVDQLRELARVIKKADALEDVRRAMRQRLAPEA